MAKSKKSQRTQFDPICAPLHYYHLTGRGLELPPGSTIVDAWRELKHIGHSLTCPVLKDETFHSYADRLDERLSHLPRDQFLNGGTAVFMARNIIEMCRRMVPPNCSRSTSWVVLCQIGPPHHESEQYVHMDTVIVARLSNKEAARRERDRLQTQYPDSKYFVMSADEYVHAQV